MHESEAYYEEILYPLQNGVLTTLATCEAPFYLTGGTALHRHYFKLRYSEDLDLFVNQDTGFGGYVDRALTTLRE
ncbi:MAG: nucleotidyl transferase AbiEii/AbiGii toxin family protein [Spirochaetaceae bacterium]|nr:nucleotidyl transferase AbiEii/AbiGii toxin family protein [Spirochaetaceae bacterium]